MNMPTPWINFFTIPHSYFSFVNCSKNFFSPPAFFNACKYAISMVIQKRQLCLSLAGCIVFPCEIISFFPIALSFMDVPTKNNIYNPYVPVVSNVLASAINNYFSYFASYGKRIQRLIPSFFFSSCRYFHTSSSVSWWSAPWQQSLPMQPVTSPL